MNRLPESFITLFFASKICMVICIEEVKPSPYRKTIKLLTFDNLFPPLRHSRLNPWQNDDGYHVFPPK